MEEELEAFHVENRFKGFNLKFAKNCFYLSMDKLKLAFKLVKAKNNAEKALMSLYSEANLNSSVDKSINSLIDSLSHEQHIEDATSYEVFVKYLKKCHSWKTAVKLLLATHQVIHKIGAPFCSAFTSEEFENIRNFSKSKQGLDYVYEVMTANYYSFLICYANCYEDIQVFSRIRQHEVIASIEENQTFYIPKLYALKELVEYVTKIEGSIRNSLKHSKHQVLFEKIASLIISDTITANNIITNVLEEAKHLIFKVNPEIALMLDELYSDTVHITRKLKPFLEGLQLPSHLYVPPVKYFNFDPEFNKKEELFMLDIKKNGNFKLQKAKTLNQREKAPYIRTYSSVKEDKQEVLSPSQVNYLSNYQEVKVKSKRNPDNRGPLQEKMRNSNNYNQRDEIVSPDQPEEKKFLSPGIYSPDISSPGSSENLVDPDGNPRSHRLRLNEEESILKSPEGSGWLNTKGRNANMNQIISRKIGSVPAKENARFRNQDISPTEL